MTTPQRTKAINALDVLIRAVFGNSAPDLAAQICDCIAGHAAKDAVDQMRGELIAKGVLEP